MWNNILIYFRDNRVIGNFIFVLMVQVLFLVMFNQYFYSNVDLCKEYRRKVICLMIIYNRDNDNM